jgi:hypothetical protein
VRRHHQIEAHPEEPLRKSIMQGGRNVGQKRPRDGLASYQTVYLGAQRFIFFATFFFHWIRRKENLFFFVHCENLPFGRSYFF